MPMTKEEIAAIEERREKFEKTNELNPPRCPLKCEHLKKRWSEEIWGEKTRHFGYLCMKFNMKTETLALLIRHGNCDAEISLSFEELIAADIRRLLDDNKRLREITGLDMDSDIIRERVKRCTKIFGIDADTMSRESVNASFSSILTCKSLTEAVNSGDLDSDTCSKCKWWEGSFTDCKIFMRKDESFDGNLCDKWTPKP